MDEATAEKLATSVWCDITDGDGELVSREYTVRRVKQELLAAASTSCRDRTPETETCPCFFTTPCHKDCSCVHPLMSRGCDRCCRHGSMEQRKAKAEGLARMHEQSELEEI